MKTFEEKYLTKIRNLFEKYKGKMGDQALNCILDRGFVSSLPNMNAEILICGINPSDNGKRPENFHFQALKNAPYFTTIHDIVSDCKDQNAIDYLDLFCFRNTNQYDIWQFAKNPVGLKYIVDHLMLTQEIIEEINPKVLLVFNKTAATFFGFHANPSDENPENKNIWMGYKFKDCVTIDNMYSNNVKSIIGLHESRINPDLEETSLNGSKIFFGSYMRYLKTEKKAELRKLISTLS